MRTSEWKEVERCLDEILTEARVNGMSDEGLERATHVLKVKYRDVWRLNLGPSDRANVPPLKLEIDGEFTLPKPHMRRYSPSEMEW